MSVVNFFTKEQLNIQKIFKITKYSTLKIIKEQIFSSTDSLISVETMAISVNSKYIINSSYSYDGVSTIYMFNLIDELSSFIRQNALTFVNITKEGLKKILEDLSKTYTDLTYYTLKLVIDYILLKNLKMYVDSDQIEENINNWKKTLLLTKKTLKDKYHELYLNVSKSILSNYINFTGEDYSYSIISNSIVYSLSNITTDISLRIIKEFPVDFNLPLIFYKNIKEDNPFIKVNKSLDKNLIKKWIIMSKNTGKIIYKKLNGIIFKFKDDSEVKYNPKNYRISIKGRWEREDFTNYQESVSILSNLTNVVKKFKKILNYNVSLHEEIFSSTTFRIIIKKFITLSKLRLSLKDFINVLKVDPLNDKYLKLNYINSHITFLIKETSVSDKGIKSKVNLIEVNNVSNMYEINLCISLIIKVFINAESKIPLIFRNDQIILQEEPTELNKKIVSINVKNIKQKGVNINATSCQKDRQPMISSEKALTHVLSYKNNNFICNNQPYIYPGFTNKNAVCCFKRDQRTKKAYLRNMVPQETITGQQLPDKDILKTILITTDKILEQNRLGVLPVFLKDIFGLEYLKLGNNQDRLSIFNALNIVSNKNKTLQNLINFADTNYSNINNTQLSKAEYIKYLNTKWLNDNIVLELLCVMFEINIIIFTQNTIICKEKSNSEYYNDVCFLIKNDIYYEIIVKSKTELQKVFTNDSVVKKVKQMYNQGCAIKYVGYPEPPLTLLQVTSKASVLGQIINHFGNVTYVNTKEYNIIPVAPGLPLKNIKNIKISKYIINAKEHYKILIDSKINYIHPVSQISNSRYTIGLVLKCGLIVPTKPSSVIKGVPTVDAQFVYDIDTLLFNAENESDYRSNYIKKVQYYKELYELFRYTLSQKIGVVEQNVFSYIDKILIKEVNFVETMKPSDIPYKRIVCSSLSNDTCSSNIFCLQTQAKCTIAITKKLYKNFIIKLGREIMQDNKKVLLNKAVKDEIYDDNNYIKRNNEVLLLNDSIYNYIYS